MKKALSFLSAISGIAFLIYLYKLFAPSSSTTGTILPFPKAAEKAAAEKEVAQFKEELEKAGEKKYSDKDIEEKFNK